MLIEQLNDKQESRFLHFETCYYTPVEQALQQGWRRFEPGAGVPKSRVWRGFQSVNMHSVHFFCDAELHRMVSERLQTQRDLLQADGADDFQQPMNHVGRTVLRGTKILDTYVSSSDGNAKGEHESRGRR